MHDIVVIGAGPAGLMAATYLGRFHRRPLVLESGVSRARWIPTSHNIPGFRRGVSGVDLLHEMREQAAQYGADIRAATVTALALQAEGFTIYTADSSFPARFVVLATGISDHLPPLAGAPEALLRSVLRVCPICDGFEATGKRIAVIGAGEHGRREAQFLQQTYSESVSYLDLEGVTDASDAYPVAGIGMTCKRVRLQELTLEGNSLWLRREGAPVERFDVCYSALGCTPQQSLARSLGAQCDENGALQVDRHQQTSINGLYAAGDVVRGLNQVVVAAAEAAIAATDIHNRLGPSRHPRTSLTLPMSLPEAPAVDDQSVTNGFRSMCALPR